MVDFETVPCIRTRSIAVDRRLDGENAT